MIGLKGWSHRMHFWFLRLHTIVAYNRTAEWKSCAFVQDARKAVRRDTRVKDTHPVDAYIEKEIKISVVEHKNMFWVNQGLLWTAWSNRITSIRTFRLLSSHFQGSLVIDGYISVVVNRRRQRIWFLHSL